MGSIAVDFELLDRLDFETNQGMKAVNSGVLVILDESLKSCRPSPRGRQGEVVLEFGSVECRG